MSLQKLRESLKRYKELKKSDLSLSMGFPGGASGKEPACQGRCRQHKRCGFSPWVEKGMATHSSILAWRIPQTEEPDGLQPLGLHTVRHD